MDLRTIDRYLKLRALAEAPGNANEKSTAARQVREMEAEHPDVREKAEAVARAMAGERPLPGAESDPWGGGLAAFLKATAKAAAGEAASQFMGGVTGAVDRFDRLEKGEVTFTEHECAEGQVCLEIRARVADVMRVRTRRSILATIEDALIEAADD